MTLLTEAEVDNPFSFDWEKEALRVIGFSLSFLGFPYDWQIGLTLTDDEGIREANKEFRGIDRATDVLSFPMLEYGSAGDFSDEEAFSLSKDPSTGEVLLGDILINKNRVQTQAEEYGHTEFREYAFLLVHSVLHLCGFDHEAEEEEMEMRKKQDEILDGLEIFR